MNSSITDKYVLNIKVHPRDNFEKYKQYENVRNVNILSGSDIETDIKDSDCVISGPSSSIHEVALLGKIYTVLWPFDNYENEYLSNESLVKNIEDLNHKIFPHQPTLLLHLCHFYLELYYSRILHNL